MPNKPKSTTEIDEPYDVDLFPAYRAIQSRLGNRMVLDRFELYWPDLFSIAFVRLFLADCPNYQQPDGTYGASRSNWTYHTALAMAQAAKLLDFSCKFETLGKRDAIVESRHEPPITVLVAEWEWDSGDIFGKGKELDKLRATCRVQKDATAFLLTYCTEEHYANYLERIVDDWCPANGRQRRVPGLYFHTIIFSEHGPVRQFERLRTAVITDGRVELWCDEVFD